MSSVEKSESSKCFECSTETRKKNLKECTDCSQLFCKKHIRVNDNDYSTLCSPCLKKRVHLEISMGMETEILQHKSELREVQSKLKTCKKDLQSLESTFASLSDKLKSSKKEHKKTCKVLETNLDEAKSVINWENYNEILGKHAKTKTDFKVFEDKMQESKGKNEENSAEIGNLQKDIDKYSQGISELSEKVGLHVPYTIIRALCCEKCKDSVKTKFSVEIKKGYLGRNSIMASMHTDSRKSVNSSSSSTMNKKHSRPDQDSCNCLVF